MSANYTQDVLDALDWMLGVKKDKKSSTEGMLSPIPSTDSPAQSGQKKVEEMKQSYESNQGYIQQLPKEVAIDQPYYSMGVKIVPKQQNVPGVPVQGQQDNPAFGNIPTTFANVDDATKNAIYLGADPATLQFAKSRLNKQQYIGWCEKFVADSQGRAKRYATAYQAWLGQKDTSSSDMSNIKPGDAVYFTPTRRVPEGHTGIYSGDGKFISPTDYGVRELPIKYWQDVTGQKLLGFVPLNKDQANSGQVLSAQSNQKSNLQGVKFGDLIQQIWPKDQWENIPRVLQGENASMNPTIVGHNRDGSIDVGLMQINSNTFADFMRRKKKTLEQHGITNFQDMMDPAKNLKMAKIIYEEQGWNAWYGAPADLRG